MTIITTENPTLAWSVKEQPDWLVIGELLKTAQYEQIIATLPELKRNSEGVERARLANVLAAIRLLSLACSHYQAEQARHRQACEEIRQREQELKRYLRAILNLIGQKEDRYEE